METIFKNQNGASYFGKTDLSDAQYQMNLTKRQKIYAQSTHLRDCSRCADYPMDSKTPLQSSFQKCIESTIKGITEVLIFQDDVLVYGTTKEHFDKRMLAVKSRLPEKIFYY